MSRSSSSGPMIFLASDGKLPVGERRPAHPFLWRWALRGIVLLCYVLAWAQPAMVEWADRNDPKTIIGWTVAQAEKARLADLSPQERNAAQMTANATKPLRQAGVSVVRVISRKPLSQIVLGVALGGLALLIVEMSVAAWVMTRYRARAAHMGRMFLRVRPLRPQSRKGGKGSAQNPADLWRALHTALIEIGMGATPPPYLAFTLHAKPQEPASLGVVIAEGRATDAPIPAALAAAPRLAQETTRPSVRYGSKLPGRRDLAPVRVPRSEDVPAAAQRRVSLRRAIDKIITGQDAETIVDERDDPLASALKPGMVVVWQDLTLTLAPHMLIRTSDDADGDMMGGLAASLKTPSGVAHTEIQVVARPRRDLDVDTPWRVLARRRLIGLRRKMMFGGQSEVKVLESKIAGETYDVTVRLVVVAEHAAALPAARATLREMRAAFGQYQRRAGVGVQRFRGAGVGITKMVVVPDPAAPSLLAWLNRGGRALVAPTLVWGLLGVSSASAAAAMLKALELAAILGLGALPLSAYSLLQLSAATLIAGLLLRGATTLPRDALASILARTPRPTPPTTIVSARLWAPPMIMASEEVGSLWHLPSVELKTLIQWLPNRYLPPQPHVFIPDGAKDRIVLGYARRSDGSEAPVGPSLRDLRKILHLTAGMGAGKSRALANMAYQLVPNGFILLDGKGDDAQGSLAATSRSYIPQGDEHRLVLLDLLDADWPIGMNPLASIDLSDPVGASKALGTVMAVFSRLDPDTWGKSMGMQQYAQMATMLVLSGEKHPTIAHVKQALQDEKYRERLIPLCDNIEVRTFWTVTFPQTGDQQKTSRDALLRRFDNLMVNEITRYLLTQPIPTVDLLEAMEEGHIVIIALPHVTLGDDLAGIAGMILFQAIVRAAFRRPGTDQTRATVPLIIDEFQQFASDGESEDVRTAMTQLRSLGIGGVYAHQSLKQLGKLVDEMLQNSASRLILSTNEPDASVYARQFPGSDLTPADIDGQQFLEHQYAVFSGDHKAEVCSIRPLMWPTPVQAVAPPYHGAEGDWKKQLPPAEDEETAAANQAIIDLIYGEIDIRHVSAQLALLPDDEWDELLARWDVIRQHQRRYIIKHPGCIADRLERQRWLSRLGFATPRVLAAAGYQRQRWAITPGEEAADVAQETESTRRERERYTIKARVNTQAPVSGVTNSEARTLKDVVPLQPSQGEMRDLQTSLDERRRPRRLVEILGERERLIRAGSSDYETPPIVRHPSPFDEPEGEGEAATVEEPVGVAASEGQGSTELNREEG